MTKVYSVDPAAATAKLEQFSTVPIAFANLDAAGVLAAVEADCPKDSRS
ncbi:MAG TPA: hypothetical protein VJ783_00130 [Pirellulales bacterium]|nr:hypothetical protein [Pirellulales bacterium]